MMKNWRNEISSCRQDFGRFATHLERTLYDHQRAATEQFEKSQFFVLKKPRQSGATVLEIMYALWKALFNTHEEVLFVSPNSFIAAGIIARIQALCMCLPKQFGAEATKLTKNQIIFPSGNTVTSVSAAKVEGLQTPTVAIMDEAAFMQDHGMDLAKKVYRLLRPAVLLGGKLIVTSTKNTTEDFFWKKFCNAKAGRNEFDAMEWLFNGMVVINYKEERCKSQ